jgi:YD repeat-containing protein
MPISFVVPKLTKGCAAAKQKYTQALGSRYHAMLRRYTMYSCSAAVALTFSEQPQANAATNYTYDRLGRLTSALYENGLCVAYSYDANGNRTAINSAPAGSPVWGVGSFGCIYWTAP